MFVRCNLRLRYRGKRCPTEASQALLTWGHVAPPRQDQGRNPRRDGVGTRSRAGLHGLHLQWVRPADPTVEGAPHSPRHRESHPPEQAVDHGSASRTAEQGMVCRIPGLRGPDGLGGIGEAREAELVGQEPHLEGVQRGLGEDSGGGGGQQAVQLRPRGGHGRRPPASKMGLVLLGEALAVLQEERGPCGRTVPALPQTRRPGPCRGAAPHPEDGTARPLPFETVRLADGMRRMDLPAVPRRHLSVFWNSQRPKEEPADARV
jgi:hypothetical protein